MLRVTVTALHAGGCTVRFEAGWGGVAAPPASGRAVREHPQAVRRWRLLQPLVVPFAPASAGCADTGGGSGIFMDAALFHSWCRNNNVEGDW